MELVEEATAVLERGGVVHKQEVETERGCEENKKVIKHKTIRRWLEYDCFSTKKCLDGCLGSLGKSDH